MSKKKEKILQMLLNRRNQFNQICVLLDTTDDFAWAAIKENNKETNILTYNFNQMRAEDITLPLSHRVVMIDKIIANFDTKCVTCHNCPRFDFDTCSLKCDIN